MQPPRIVAARAGPDARAMREAYLDLLKLTLCDLAGGATTSVGRLADGTTFTRRVSGDGLKIRALGMDWPLDGLTMVGLARLNDVQRCVEAVVADGVPGDLIETGVWRGGASILMRATLDTLGDDREVWLADSFGGFADDDKATLSGSVDDEWMDYVAVSVERVRENLQRLGCDRGVRFVEGYFADTLTALDPRPWSLIRLDADSYEATKVALEALYPSLSPGGFVIVDDYGAIEGCRAAVDEYRVALNLSESLEWIDWTGVRWRRGAGG
jgi:O-methyltransferase